MDIFLKHTELPWQRGPFDCFAAVADQLREWTGVDPMERYRGRYKTVLGYMRIVRKDGYADEIEAFCGEMQKHGWREVEEGPWEDRDVAMVSYIEARTRVDAPAIFWRGSWNVRSKAGWLNLLTDDGVRLVHRYGS